MLQWLFDLANSRPGAPLPGLAHRVRHRLARVWNPDVRWVFEGRTLVVPLSHDFAWNRGLFPGYTDNLHRVAGFLRARDGVVRLVDVGANVGDTYLLTRPAPGDRALLVEGAPRYARLLVRNVGRDPGVICVRALLADRESGAVGGMVYAGGNATIAPGSAGGDAFETLDGVLARHPEFGAPTLVKVDVEGYDGRVLRGARTLLAAHAPVVMFEHHPRMIDVAGDDPAAVFADLAALGYGALIVYDNFGDLLGTLDPMDGAGVARLIATARARDGYYHDVIAFPEARAADREAFLAAERARPRAGASA
jgi:FkbM family methyltransferase